MMHDAHIGAYRASLYARMLHAEILAARARRKVAMYAHMLRGLA